MAFTRTNFTTGEHLHGFTLKKLASALDDRAEALEFYHEKSGARLLHLHADDTENLFAIAFATPPPDNTGLPHILEHTALCGSEKFPVKDPFVELLKTSLATFLNAMTYPDRTVYPCASMNPRDFFNLAKVYADAVFQPRLTPEHFAQEGWRYEFAGDNLQISGVVYNEMKGAYSDLDGILGREEMARLFPDNAYGRDYGGDPRAIPQLTYAQFRDFHARYYHPANARIFIYGDIPTVEHLKFLHDEYLSKYEKISIAAAIALPQKWESPRDYAFAYPATAEEKANNEGAVTLTWHTGAITDWQRTLALKAIDSYLLGHSGSPLRRALIDSHLGGELTASGFSAYQRDAFFSVGLKGANVANADAIEQLILTTLRAEADRGFDREKIASVFLQGEMSALRIGAQYPLALMERVFNAWLYGEDPAASLRLREQLADLRERYESTPRMLENLLRETLIDNPHRLRLRALPDTEYHQKNAAQTADWLREKARALSAEQREKIRRDAQEIAAMQASPNSAAALATLPKLTLADVNPEPQTLPTVRETVAGRAFLAHDIFTNGVNYLSLAIALPDLTAEELRYLPIYEIAFEKMGADGWSYAQLADAEAACCGGICAAGAIESQIGEPANAAPYFFIKTTALNHKLGDALALIEKRWFALDFSDTRRLEDILTQSWHNEHAEITGNGHALAMSVAAKGLSPLTYWHEQLNGATKLRLLRECALNFSAEKIRRILQRIHEKIISGARLTVSAAGERIAEIRDWTARIASRMGAQKIAAGDWQNSALEIAPAKIGLATPCDVAFVAQALPTVSVVHPDAPALLLLAHHLTYDYLWNEIRAKRGAYGCGAVFSPQSGAWAFRSYRDPCIAETLATYARAADYLLREFSWSATTLSAAIIGALKKLDQPLRPNFVIDAALERELTGSSPQLRQEFRTRLLQLSAEDLRRVTEKHLAPYFNPPAANAPICVLASREKLAAIPAADRQDFVIENLFGE